MTTQDPLDQALARALEAVPHVDISDDFATRVLSRLPAARSAYLPTLPGIGRRTALASAALLFLAMFAFALAPAAPSIRTAIEIACAVEFILLTLWLSLRPNHA
jgi:hypothetical protein